MLAVALVVGAAGYAGIRGIVSSTTTTAEAAHIAPVEGEAAADRVVNSGRNHTRGARRFPVSSRGPRRKPA